MNFKKWLKLMEYVSTVGGVFLPSTWSGSEAPDTLGLSGHPPHLPSLDFGLPALTRSGRIDLLIKERNPIYVQLSDGSKLFFTIDEFRRIKGFPEIGRTMTVVFQRTENDNSDIPSKIDSCTVS